MGMFDTIHAGSIAGDLKHHFMTNVTDFQVKDLDLHLQDYSIDDELMLFYSHGGIVVDEEPEPYGDFYDQITAGKYTGFNEVRWDMPAGTLFFYFEENRIRCVAWLEKLSTIGELVPDTVDQFIFYGMDGKPDFLTLDHDAVKVDTRLVALRNMFLHYSFQGYTLDENDPNPYMDSIMQYEASRLLD